MPFLIFEVIYNFIICIIRLWNQIGVLHWKLTVMFFMVVSNQVNRRQEGCMICMFVALLNTSCVWYISEHIILYLPVQDCDSNFWTMAPNMSVRVINIYSTSVGFWGINLVAEIHVVCRTVLAFYITTNIMLHTFLLFTQTQWNKDSYSIRVVISGYHFNDRYQRYMRIYNPQRAVFGVSFCWRRLGNEVSLHWQTHFSFYWQ
jgi:hypothetical protein